MATVSEHAAAIVALAATADTLVTQFRQLMADIEAEERALYQEAINNGPSVTDAVAGRRRLGSYAHSLAGHPAGAGLPPEAEKSVSELALAAWSHYLPVEEE